MMPSSPLTTPPSAPARRRWRMAGLILAGLTLLLLAALAAWSAGALHRRLFRFPREEAAWLALRAQRQPVPDDAGWPEFRGILHAHSDLSHDSRVPPERILAAMHAARLDFVGLSDHPRVDGRADFDAQWRGLREGKLFIPGFELRDGLMPLGVRPGTVLSNRSPPADLTRQTIRHGGLLFRLHPENPFSWDWPELTGMEIYNLHTDFKRDAGSVGAYVRRHLPDLVLNLGRFPDHILYLPFRRPTEFLRHWDELNRTRHLTGIAGNDAHENVGLRASITAAGHLRIDDTSPKALGEYPLTWWRRPLLRLAFGPLEPGRELFRIQLDPYERSARLVNTHVLARALTEADILDALRVGRAWIGFDLIADSSGFRWFARSPGGTAVMGEAASLTPATRLHALSPIPCRFTLVHNGHVIGQQEGRAAEWTPTAPGKYRVEAELRVGEDWAPWIYANPIELPAAP